MNLKFKNIWIFIGLIQVILAFYLCLRPTAGPAIIPHLDKLFHFSAYVLLTGYQIQVHGLKNSKWILLFFFLQGVLIELLQLLTPDRSFEWSDMLANGLGSLYAVLFCLGFDLKILNRVEKLALKN